MSGLRVLTIREVDCIVFMRAGRRVLFVFKPCSTCFVLAKATKGVNGQLLEALCKWSKYHDAECINMFREGADLVGYLKASGNGEAIATEGCTDIGSLTRDGPAKNRLVSRLDVLLCRDSCLCSAFFFACFVFRIR